MIQPRPWGRSPFVHHSLFTADFSEGKSHYTALIVLVSHLIYTELQRPVKWDPYSFVIEWKKPNFYMSFLSLSSIPVSPPTPPSVNLLMLSLVRFPLLSSSIKNWMPPSRKYTCTIPDKTFALDCALAQVLLSLSAVQELSAVSERLLHPLVSDSNILKNLS